MLEYNFGMEQNQDPAKNRVVDPNWPLNRKVNFRGSEIEKLEDVEFSVDRNRATQKPTTTKPVPEEMLKRRPPSEQKTSRPETEEEQKEEQQEQEITSFEGEDGVKIEVGDNVEWDEDKQHYVGTVKSFSKNPLFGIVRATVTIQKDGIPIDIEVFARKLKKKVVSDQEQQETEQEFPPEPPPLNTEMLGDGPTHKIDDMSELIRQEGKAREEEKKEERGPEPLIEETPLVFSAENMSEFIRQHEQEENKSKPALASTPPPNQPQPAAPTPEPVIEDQNVPEWEKGEEGKNLYDARIKYAKAEGEYRKYVKEHGNNELKTTIRGARLSYDNLDNIASNFETAQKEYYRCLNAVGLKIKEEVSSKSGTEPLTPEQQANLASEINDTEMQFIKDERAHYKFVFNSQKEKTVLDKGLERARSALDNRVVRWYLRQNKWVRLGATTLLFTAGGYALGTAAVGGTILSAAGYGIGRGLRGTAAIVGGGFARAAAEKRWSEEDIDKKIKEEEERIKNSQESLEEKSKRYAELEAFGEKEKKWARIKKGIVAVGVGAGAGVLAGLTEHAITGGGAARSAVESGGGKGGSVQDHLPGRKGFRSDMSERLQVPRPRVTEQTVVRSGVAEQTPESSPTVSETATETKPVGAAESATAPKSDVAETTRPTETSAKIISSPHEVESGDSNWGILKKVLENNERFSKLSRSGQKSFVLSYLNNKVLEDPGQYGIDPDGGVTIGKTVDYSKLFEDQKWVNSILEKAEKLSDAKINTIEGNDASIAAFVRANPGVRITSDKIDEILNSDKPQNEIVDTATKVEPVKSPISETLEITDHNQPEPIIPEPETSKSSVASEVESLSSSEHTEPPPEVSKSQVNEEQVHQEIEEAKQRLSELESQKTSQIPAEELRPMRSLASEAEFAKALDTNFKAEINNVYGHKRLLGFLGRVDGVKTTEWNFMKSLPADKVIEYYRNPDTRNLSENILKELKTSVQHRNLVFHVTQLMEKTEIDFEPRIGENMESFIKRLGGFLMRKK